MIISATETNAEVLSNRYMAVCNSHLKLLIVMAYFFLGTFQVGDTSMNLSDFKGDSAYVH